MGVWQDYFKIPAKQRGYNADRVFTVFQIQYERGGSAQDAITALKSEGISYRRTDMLYDFRAYSSIANTAIWKTESRERALEYFTEVVEPYRAENGLSISQAYKDIKRYKQGQFTDADDEIELSGKLGGYPIGETP